MERQHGLNNQLRNLFRGHPNMNGESPVHIGGSAAVEYGVNKYYTK